MGAEWGTYDEVWQQTNNAVTKGKLASSSVAKTSTALRFGVPPDFFSNYVICVYTDDYLDMEDVMRAAGDIKSILMNSNLTNGVLAARYKPGI